MGRDSTSSQESISPFHEGLDPNESYELLQLLGEGSYGSVYKGVNRDTNTTTAIKIVSYGNKASVTAEIEFLRRLRSDFVVSYIDGYLFDGELWILMEFCEGGSLSDLHDITKTNLSEIETRAVMASCILGLEHLHNLKNIHRDIKAGNILITADGKAKLADFGVSAQLTNSKNMRKTMIGTPFWMAPELIQETLYDGKADIWSLGITILEVVEGRPPHFNVHPMRAIFMIPMKPAPRFAEPEKWSPEMSDFLGKCLTKEVDARWSARDLVHHQWIAGDVEIAKQFQGMEALRKLVHDNWDAIEASRSNQVGSDEEKGTDNDDTDSDKTATHVEGGDNDGTVGFATAKSAKVTINASTTMPSHSKSTFNKSRPSSRRIKQHTTNSRSKSTTGEARNTSSSQRLNESIGTFQKLAIGEEYSTMARTNANEGTLKVGLADYTRQMAWSADDAVSTLKAINNRDVSAGIGHVSSSYFDSKKGDSLRNPSLLYDLLQLLGEGSYGRVFKALHKESNAEVAIKIIPCDNQSDVTAELEFLRKLSCPYIVSFVDGFLFDDELWIAMEFCSAGSLSDLRELTKANLTEPQLRLALCYALLGLKHLHGLNCIHRDIKAGNILLTAAGEAKLADFGVSAQMQSATQKRRTVIGTPFWMAPEVIQETSYDYKADIWSLGVTALELCEGRPPHFEVHPMRAIFLIPIKPAPRLKEPSLWSAEMNDFVSRSLVKEADNRWSAEKLLEHPWLSGLVKDVERGHPPNDLQKLVADNIYLIQRTRELRRPSKHIMKRASVASSYDDEPEPDEASDDGSVATMEMGRDGSRETTLSSEAIAPSRRSADSEDTVDTFLVVRRGGNKSSDDDNSTWLNVDTLTNTPRYVSSEDQEESPEVQSTEEETTTFASAKEYFSNLVTKQDILRQLSLLEHQYKHDKDKLDAKYETNRSKLKLALASSLYK